MWNTDVFVITNYLFTKEEENNLKNSIDANFVKFFSPRYMRLDAFVGISKKYGGNNTKKLFIVYLKNDEDIEYFTIDADCNQFKMSDKEIANIKDISNHLYHILKYRNGFILETKYWYKVKFALKNGKRMFRYINLDNPLEKL